MSTGSAERELFLGVLALQNEFVTRDQLLLAVQQWVADKSRSLSELLVAAAAITPEERDLLDALVAQHVRRHDGDIRRSFDALSSVDSSVAEALADIGDEEISDSLAGTVLLRQTASDRLPVDDSAAAESSVRFRVLRFHARGGLGKVSVAMDSELHREVALKEIHDQHADHPESRQRFVQEAEITGGLEHPGIVPVYGLGQYRDGRPFYAMRFVHGDSLKEAIRRFHSPVAGGSDPGQRRLQLRNLLGRFIDVCNAIEYAHSRGVLHRDLKPGNIMLGRYGETLVVDWGLAKLIGVDDPGSSEVAIRVSSGSGSTPTQMGSAIGTPAYMSPEQAAGKLDQLGPTTDVYSLGATLYHLLTGRTPFEDGDPASVVQRVCSGQFPRPRDVNPLVPRALESICLKALSTATGERFASPLELAEEVEHWLADEPVKCHAEPWHTAARRWMRRHPALVSSSAVALIVGFVALAVTTGVVSGKNERIRGINGQLQTRNEELRAARDAAEAQKAVAERQKTRAEAVSEFLVKALRSPDPDLDGRELRVKDLLDNATVVLTEQFEGDLLTQATLLDAIGQTYNGLGLHHQALPVFEQALAKLEGISTQPEVGAQRYFCMHQLASARLGAGAIVDAADMSQQAVEGLRRALPERDEKLLVAEMLRGHLYLQTTENEKAFELLSRTYEGMQATLGAEHAATLSCLLELALSQKRRGKLRESLALLEPAIPVLRKELGRTHSKTLAGENNLARLYYELGRLRDAEATYRDVMDRMTQKLGSDHPSTMRLMDNLAKVLRRQSRLQEARKLYDQTLALRRKNLGDDHVDTLITLDGLAGTLQELGDLKLAIPLFEESLDKTRQQLGDRNHETLAAMVNLSLAYHRDGRLDDAESMMRQTLALQEDVFPADHPSPLVLKNNLAMLLEDRGQVAEAIEMHRQVLETRERVLGEGHIHTMSSMNNLGYALMTARRYDEAIATLKRTLDLRRRHLPAPHIQVANTAGNLGVVYRLKGDPAAAIEFFDEALRVTKAVYGPDHNRTRVARVNLTSVLFADPSRWQEAIDEMTELSEAFADQQWIVSMLSVRIGDILRRQGNLTEAQTRLTQVRNGLESGAIEFPATHEKKLKDELRQALTELYRARGEPDREVEIPDCSRG